jgi:AraC-like DNA-binding protein
MTQKQICDIISFISNHFQINISLQYISKEFAVSKYHLSHSFHEITGLTISRYISIIRIQHASSLLITTEKPIGIICEESGFSDLSYFSKVFKKETGCSPLLYRKRIQSKNNQNNSNLVITNKIHSLYNSPIGTFNRRMRMLLNINDQLSPIIQSNENRNGLITQKNIEESIVRLAVKNNVDINGKTYKPILPQTISQKDEISFIPFISDFIIHNKKLCTLGKMYEEVGLSEVNYLIGKHGIIIFILITNSNELKNHFLSHFQILSNETNQSYTWISVYDTPIISYPLKNGAGIIGLMKAS